MIKGEDENGMRIWENEVKEISNTELKSMLEAYKTRSKSSVLGDIQESRSLSQATAKKETPGDDLPFR